MHFLLEMSSMLLVTILFPSIALLLMGFNVFWDTFKDPIIQLLESPQTSVLLLSLALLIGAVCYLWDKKANKIVLNNEKNDIKLPLIFEDEEVEKDNNELMLNNIKNWK